MNRDFEFVFRKILDSSSNFRRRFFLIVYVEILSNQNNSLYHYNTGTIDGMMIYNTDKIY